MSALTISSALAFKCISLIVLVPGDNLAQPLYVALAGVHPQIPV